MQSLGIDVLFKGTNFLRLLGGLWVALRISLISVAISIVLGIGMGMLMTSKSRVLKVIFRLYLEIVRIMPQMVLLFVVYFGTTRVFGWNLEAELAAIIVFSFWGTAEMGDLVRGALQSIPAIQWESAQALGMNLRLRKIVNTEVFLYIGEIFLVSAKTSEQCRKRLHQFLIRGLSAVIDHHLIAAVHAVFLHDAERVHSHRNALFKRHLFQRGGINCIVKYGSEFFYLGYGNHADIALGTLGFVLGEIVVSLEKTFRIYPRNVFVPVVDE